MHTDYINQIFNEDALVTMQNLPEKVVDLVLTSPPYNTSRGGTTQRAFDNFEQRYDIYIDSKTDEDYLAWSVELFKGYDRVLKNNGCVLYNISYSSENTDLLWKFVAEIIYKTPFTTADCITWKKNNALPNNVSPNKLTRIIEPVFVFARKTELNTF